MKRSSPRKKSPQRRANTTRAPPTTAWNSTPFRPRPPALNGLSTDTEPWAVDEQLYEYGMFNYVTRRVPKPGEQEARMQREYNEMVQKWQEQQQHWTKEKAWNDTPYRSAPIRGLRPITREPWYDDGMKLYREAQASRHANMYGKNGQLVPGGEHGAWTAEDFEGVEGADAAAAAASEAEVMAAEKELAEVQAALAEAGLSITARREDGGGSSQQQPSESQASASQPGQLGSKQQHVDASQQQQPSQQIAPYGWGHGGMIEPYMPLTRADLREQLSLKGRTPTAARKPGPIGATAASRRQLGDTTFSIQGDYSNFSSHATSRPAPQSHAARVAKLSHRVWPNQSAS